LKAISVDKYIPARINLSTSTKQLGLLNLAAAKRVPTTASLKMNPNNSERIIPWAVCYKSSWGSLMQALKSLRSRLNIAPILMQSSFYQLAKLRTIVLTAEESRQK